MSIVRVDYHERQRLGAADLEADQDYHRYAQRRHQGVGPHRRGIVWGLALEASGTSVTLMPGAAVDDSDRLLVLPEPLDLKDMVAEAADRLLQGAGRLNVWVTGEERPANLGRRPRSQCGAGHHHRFRERASVS